MSTLGYTTGLYYPGVGGGTLTGQTQTLNRAYATPFLVTKASTFDRIATVIWTSVATATVRLGIYADNGHRYPGALILDAGTIDASLSSFQEIAISQALNPGLYWLISASQGSAASKMYAYASNPSPGHLAFNNPASYASSAPTGFIQDSVSGALPANFSTTVTPTGSNSAIATFLRAA